MASDVKWIKITTDIFDDEKILLIESLPDAYAIITVWFKLLCLAGKQNNSGVFMMGKIAYTDKMLATIFRMKEATVTMALQTFEQFGMVEIIDGVITIPNWGKHQNLDQLESKKEYMRNYMQEYRAKQKRLLGNNKLCENGLSMTDWSAVLSFFNHECAYCGSKEGLEQEHIIPVNDGGTYCIGNIVPACRSCNASKGTKSVDSWYSKSEVFNTERQKRLNEYRCKTNVNDLHKANVSQAEEEREKEEERDIDKDKKSVRETTHTIFQRLSPDYDLSSSVAEKLEEWIIYKTERKESYKEQGMKSLLRQVENNYLQYGSQAICDLIDECMASGWKGIIFDRLKQKPIKQQPYRKQTKADELDSFYQMAKEWSES